VQPDAALRGKERVLAGARMRMPQRVPRRKAKRAP